MSSERKNGGVEERGNLKEGSVHNKPAIGHFREFRVYKQAFEAAMCIFRLSKRWPTEERYSLTDQIRRSSRSVCANIAEAWHKRRYVPHFISKLTDADTELGETQTWLHFAVECGYISSEDYRKLIREYRAVSGGVVKMMAEPEKWCGPSLLVREDGVRYDTETD